MEKSLDLTIRLKSAEEFVLTVYEPQTGDFVYKTFPVSVDEHPEFDSVIGREIYSWIEIMLDRYVGKVES